MRVGMNTGEVVVRSIRKDDLHTDYVRVGHSTNIASRMESLATPGAIVVSEQTHKLTEGYFEFKALGEAQVKGVSEPLNDLRSPRGRTATDQDAGGGPAGTGALCWTAERDGAVAASAWSRQKPGMDKLSA